MRFSVHTGVPWRRCRARSPGWRADEGKNHLNSARSSGGDQAGRAANFIDSIDP